MKIIKDKIKEALLDQAGRIGMDTDDEVEMMHTEICRILDNQWISVEDELPEKGEWVLCQRSQTSMSGIHKITPSVGKLRNSTQFTCEMDWINVTHWMPLPAPPEK